MATLYLVSTPIGNLGDITARAAETLASVSRVLAEDTRRTRILLNHLDLRTPLVSLHSHNEASRQELALDWLAAGEDLALVSDAGTPLVSDPGHRLVNAVAEAGYPVVPVPGPSAVLAALAASGFPGDRFCFLGFPPRKGADRVELLQRLATSRETTVLFESPERVRGLLKSLLEECGSERQVVVAREMTKLHEEFIRGSLAHAVAHFRAHSPRGEFVIVVSPAPAGEGFRGVDEAAAGALARALLDEGYSPSRAAGEVARRLKIPRNLSYEVVQNVADRRGEPA